MDQAVKLETDFYDWFYPIAEKSKAHGLFCERVYGKNLCQHGMADMHQLEMLLSLMDLSRNSRLLDVGCGSGRITEYLQEQTGCFATGLDFSPAAVRLARERTEGLQKKLRFDNVSIASYCTNNSL